MRGLAVRVGINQSHLSRALRGANSKRVSGELAGQIAIALGLPRDYFPEYREAVAVEAVRGNEELRENVYRRVLRKRGKSAS